MSVYIQNLTNSASRNNFTNMIGRTNGFNQAELVFGKRTNTNGNFVNTSGIQNLSNMTSNANKLLESARNLMNPETFNRTTVTSSNANALSIASTRNAAASFTPIQVDIEQIATGQTNRGTGLTANALSGFAGTHTFEIEVDGRTHQLSFSAGYR